MTNTTYRYKTLDSIFIFRALLPKQFTSNFTCTQLYKEEMRPCLDLSYAVAYKAEVCCFLFSFMLLVALRDSIL